MAKPYWLPLHSPISRLTSLKVYSNCSLLKYDALLNGRSFFIFTIRIILLIIDIITQEVFKGKFCFLWLNDDNFKLQILHRYCKLEICSARMHTCSIHIMQQYLLSTYAYKLYITFCIIQKVKKIISFGTQPAVIAKSWSRLNFW